MTTTTQTTVPKINGVDREKLSQTINLIRADSRLARFQFRIENEWVDCAHTRSKARNFFGAGQDHTHTAPFVIHADEPPLLLGSDQGPNPGEQLLHALAACVTSAMAYHAAARGIAIQEIESSIEGDVDLRGFLGLDETVRNGFEQVRMKFRIKADVPDAQLQEICNLGTTYSPVFDCLTNGLPVNVSAERMP